MDCIDRGDSSGSPIADCADRGALLDDVSSHSAFQDDSEHDSGAGAPHDDTTDRGAGAPMGDSADAPALIHLSFP